MDREFSRATTRRELLKLSPVLLLAELSGQLAERQQRRLVHVMFDRRPSSEEHVRRHGEGPAVPHAKRVQGHVEQFGHVVLREIRIATQLAKRAQAAHTTPVVAAVGKRPPAYVAGDHEPFRHDPTRCRNRRVAKL